MNIVKLFRFGLCVLFAWSTQVSAIEFSAHPRMAGPNTADSNEVARILAQGDELLKKDLYVPEKEGQWIFYYNCTNDNTRLKAETPEKHVCPTCKTVYTDERTLAAYRAFQNYMLEHDCEHLADAYYVSRDEKYARHLRKALLEIARIYPTLQRHDKEGRTGDQSHTGGRRFAQSLDDAIDALTLARAYDAVAGASCFTDEDRKQIEDGFLKPCAREVDKYAGPFFSHSNHQTWFNACFVTVGVATGDEDLIKLGIHGEHGLMWQLENSVTDDGLWYEGSMAYHYYALSALEKTLEAARAVGLDFTNNKRLKSLWFGPAHLAYPNGKIPVFNDSDPTTINNYTGFNKWGADYFKDPRLPDLATKPVTGSENLKGTGIAVLKRGSGTNAVCAMIDYGPHGGSHGHPDKLNIVLYALGDEYLLDPGRISYSVKEYHTWCRTTVAHNTLVIDGKDQQPTTGECLYFIATNNYSATICSSDGAYPGFRMTRALVLTDELLVDVFSVTGEKESQFDWFIHSHGTTTSDLNFTAITNPLGTTNGYQHLTSLAQAKGTNNFTYSFDQGKGPVRMWITGDEDAELFRGIGIGYNLKDSVPFLMRRKRGTSTVFFTVYDLIGKGSVKSLETLPVTIDGKPLPQTDGIGLKIDNTTFGIDLRDVPTSVTLEGIRFNRIILKPSSD